MSPSGAADTADRPPRPQGWTFMTHHARVLIAVARDPAVRLCDVAERLDVTERTVRGIVADLEAGRYVSWTRVGRGARYTVHPDRPFRHRAAAGHRVGELLDVLLTQDRNPSGTTAALSR